MEEHYRKLERMYLRAPVQKIYPGINLHVSKGHAEITLPVSEIFFHAGGSLHGSVYFRLLDDAAYFAVNSMQNENFMLTSNFHIDLLRPVTEDTLMAKGDVIKYSEKLSIAESELFNSKGKLVAKGKGTFMLSELKLTDVSGYVDPD